MLQALSSWHLVLFLFITSSLADWSLDSPSGGEGGLDDPASQLRLDANPIVPNSVTDDFSTSGVDGVLNLAQVSHDGNIGEVANVGIDPSTFEIAGSGCSPPSPDKKRRRVRRGDDSTACSAGDMFKNTPSQFKQPAAEPGKKQTPTADPGSKTPPSANASPRKFIPKLSPEAEHLSSIFLPKENRPREDEYICRKQGYYIPVCARDASELSGQMNGGFANFLDPCLPGTSFVFVLSPSPWATPSPPPASQLFLLYLYGRMNPEEKEQSMDVPETNKYTASGSDACPLLLSKWCCGRVEIALKVRRSPPIPEYTYSLTKLSHFVWPMHLHVILVSNRRFICPLPTKSNDQARNIADPWGKFFPRHLAPSQVFSIVYIESNVWIEERQSLQIYRNQLHPNTQRAGIPFRLLALSIYPGGF